MKGNFIVSGVHMGDTGVGRVLSTIQSTTAFSNYRIITTGPETGVISALGNWNILKFVKGVQHYIKHRLKFASNVLRISHSNVVYLFPQGGGYWVFKVLLFRGNNVFYYVMDNSFFCIKSYNFHDEAKVECFKCLDLAFTPDPCCKPFPIHKSREKALREIRSLGRISKKIVFLVQNRRQAELLNRFYGNVRHEVVGLCVDLSPIDESVVPLTLKNFVHNCKSPKILFHGSILAAKGIIFFITLASLMPECVFVVPDSRCSVEANLGRKVEELNIVFKPCRWDNGLAFLVGECDLVFVPSLWSAPIEGAFIKSLKFAKVVVTVGTEMGYEGEIFEVSNHVRVSRNLQEAASEVSNILVKQSCSTTFPDGYQNFEIFSGDFVYEKIKTALEKY